LLDSEPTIEHILPQSPDESWQEDLGQEFERIQRSYLHTLGNLTLVTQEWNSSLSNAPFRLKREKLASHALKLNSAFFSREIRRWDEPAIRSRVKFLTERILEIWPLLGQPSVHRKHERPKMLLLCGDQFEVRTWREVAYLTVKFILENTDKFQEISRRFPSHIASKEFPHGSQRLPNGWWVNVNLGAENVRNFCRNVMIAAGFKESDWRPQ
jgi:hypothetical protein